MYEFKSLRRRMPRELWYQYFYKEFKQIYEKNKDTMQIKGYDYWSNKLYLEEWNKTGYTSMPKILESDLIYHGFYEYEDETRYIKGVITDDEVIDFSINFDKEVSDMQRRKT